MGRPGNEIFDDKSHKTVSVQEPLGNEKQRENTPVVDAETGIEPLPVRPTARQKFLTLLEDQWFLVAMGILIAIASQVQVPESQQKLKEKVISYLCVSIIFFVTGCTLDTATLIHNYARWKVHIWAQAQCFLLSSALIFGIVSATATNRNFMDPGLLVGLIFESCVATTMSSNVIMTGQAHGNQALTVVQTTIGNFIGVFVSPPLIVMYTSVPTWYNAVLPSNSGNFAAVYRRVLMQLGLSIYLPMAVGQGVRYFFPNVCATLFKKWKLNKISSLSMLMIIWSTYDQAFATHAFSSVPGDNMIFIVFISLGIWVLLFGVCFWTSLLWLPKKDVVSMTYVVPAKSTAMGVPLSTTMWAGLSLQLESKIQIPIVIYQGLQIALGSILIAVFRKWIDRDEALAAEKHREQEARGRSSSEDLTHEPSLREDV